MKVKIFLLAIIITSALSGNLLGASCGSCEGEKKPAAVKAADASCPDGVCASTTDKHKHEESKKEDDHAKVATINTAGLKTLIDSGVPLTVLDARSGKWDDGKRLPGALSLNSESKLEEITKVLPKKDALIVTYCSNLKCPASHKLFEHLKSNGYTNLIEYPEGIEGWLEAGNPVK